MVRIVINGATGKMGRMVVSVALKDPDLKIAGLVSSPRHKGERIEDLPVTDDIYTVIDGPCVVIDFSHPSALRQLVEAATSKNIPLVIGTTGYGEDEMRLIYEGASKIPILFSPNMSEGVNLFLGLARRAASVLGHGTSAKITERHHVHKKDAPSGTAKRLKELVSKYIDGVEIKSIREDEIIGDHEILFAREGEEIRLSHSALTREIFAKGAIHASKWIVGKQPGLYSMDDVIFGGDRV